MRVIILPDEGEWVLVPKVATEEMEKSAENAYEESGPYFPSWKVVYSAMLAAAPPVKVVELPERKATPASMLPHDEIVWQRGFNSYRDEIERRAK